MAWIWWPKPDATSRTSGVRDVEGVEESRGESAAAIASELRSADPGSDHEARYLASVSLGAELSVVIVVSSNPRACSEERRCIQTSAGGDCDPGTNLPDRWFVHDGRNSDSALNC